ncbi:MULTISPECIES: carbohydrate ABC transporter permease [Pseudothermotoga]|jgi:multiple sugar transport system permease protein|uniref:Binding-protein-dependent transport systems inner membrane component n=1 Tax=Pseudothermotoga lettingae (strain ATCC BAA-301 / DSM 14385 / NBRC 107922 / TMO) TaxID=416591 RepID=A8F3C5_PSELT|nr:MULTISPECIES: carbohydrate ABC transporter permease [Pseudothermotoga]ABV32659.1 binding-protein-dependent transport systems inner membrane component [Pseudothermotoga lettingae TMO]MDI3494707.1 multiple sugar transport system permease protein [Pseudothermotoga sp.]MDK2885082.1 multiple sugar transport system permease protein [Pseudothermotoga sp.]GLI48350.1 sugar ABC transporter permease [Pseudothermotoga lettingae TMO]
MRKFFYVLAFAAICLWFIGPIFFVFLASLTPASEFYQMDRIFPEKLTFEHIYKLLVNLGGWRALLTSVQVALISIAVSFALGIPAGYAVTRYIFPGKNFIKLTMLFTRSIPLVVIAVSLVTIYLRFNLADTMIGVALAHAAMILPFVVLITSSIFSGVFVEYEEAGMIFGLSRFGAFLKITIPLALPGLAASAIFAFIMSWNEVFAASVLAITDRTLPAHILNTAMASPDYFKFAAGTIMAVPAMVFIFIIRKYLISMWGISLK